MQGRTTLSIFQVILFCSVLSFTFGFQGYGAEEPIDPTTYILDPLIEGSYDIEIECRDNPAPKDCLAIEGPTKLAVIHSSRQKYGPFGITISIINPKVAIPLYEFTVHTVKSTGAILVGNINTEEYRPSEIYFEFNKFTKEILAWVRDPQFASDLKITGKQTSSPKSLYQKVTQVMSLSELQGAYSSNSKSPPPILTIRPTMSGNPPFFASYVTDVGAKLYAHSGNFFPEEGVITLVFSGALKWTLAVSSDENGNIHLNGLGVSTMSGTSYSLSFTKNKNE